MILVVEVLEIHGDYGQDLNWNWIASWQIYHADDMSGIIIDSYERYINNKPINLNEQIKNYHNV